MDTYVTIARVLNVIFGCVGILLLLRKAHYYWGDYHSRTKDVWWVLFSWCLAIVLGTIEVLLNWDTQFRVLFTFFALVLTIKVISRPNEVKKPTFTDEF